MNHVAFHSLTFVLSLSCASGLAEDAACHLQVSNAVHTSTNAALVGECPLPANSQWCKVSLGPAQFRMAVYSSMDIVSQSICGSGTWEISANDISSIGQPGHALDIGANVGFYSLVLAASGWNVTAFEPMAKNSELIEASLCENPDLKAKITLNKVGLGSKDDHCIVISGDDNLGDGIVKCGVEAAQPVQSGYHKRASIDIRRLDDILAEQSVKSIDFVKMDVEGFECQVMGGGQSLLTKFRPKLIQSEVWHSMQGCQPQDYLASFAKASYTVADDRTCTHPDLTRPSDTTNRFMCRKSAASLLQTSSKPKYNERSIVWLQAA